MNRRAPYCRLWQLGFWISFLALCWLWMMYMHEFGHILFAIFTGAHISRVDLAPWQFSYTQLTYNPYPLVVTWAGLCIGALIPVLIWWCWRRWQLAGEYLARFFAGFCLIANGTYWAGGVWLEAGDAADAVRFGTPTWVCVLTGVTCVVVGLYFWDGLRGHLGRGKADGHVDPRVVLAFLVLLVTTVLVATALHLLWNR